MQKEIWKPILGFENLYEVSNLGNVKSLFRVSENKGSYNGFTTVQEKILKQTTNRLGYKVVTLYKNSSRHFKIVHRLVAESFLDNKNNFLEVNHKDLNKANNNVFNLEWCDRAYNVNHFYKSKNKTSKYKGVSYQKDRNKWISFIDILNKRLVIGRFETEEIAKNKRLEFIQTLKTINYEELI